MPAALFALTSCSSTSNAPPSGIGIDLEKHTVTLELGDGTAQTFAARPDVDLSRHKVGERIVFRVTEMVAIWVEKL